MTLPRATWHARALSDRRCGAQGPKLERPPPTVDLQRRAPAHTGPQPRTKGPEAIGTPGDARGPRENVRFHPHRGDLSLLHSARSARGSGRRPRIVMVGQRLPERSPPSFELLTLSHTALASLAGCYPAHSLTESSRFFLLICGFAMAFVRLAASAALLVAPAAASMWGKPLRFRADVSRLASHRRSRRRRRSSASSHRRRPCSLARLPARTAGHLQDRGGF